MDSLYTNDQVSFAVGTGRCGTKFLHEVLNLDPQVSSVHERNPLNETFHRYCKWYGIPIDHEGFLHTKQVEIELDLEKAKLSFESSAHLSLSVLELQRRFNAKFILLVRTPHKVINSYLRKGWYSNKMIRSDYNLPPSFQESKLFHHFLGRIAPLGEKYLEWERMGRVGKLAWYWNALNERVIEQFSYLPEDKYTIEKLEDLNYDAFLRITQFLGLETTVTEQEFEKVASSRPNAYRDIPSLSTWSESDIEDYKKEIQPMSDCLGYSKEINQEEEKDKLQVRDIQIATPSQHPLRLPSLIKKIIRKATSKR